MSKAENLLYKVKPGQRMRRCDCGCKRPAIYFIREFDLGFSLRCRDKFDAASKWYNSHLQRSGERTCGQP